MNLLWSLFIYKLGSDFISIYQWIRTISEMYRLSLIHHHNSYLTLEFTRENKEFFGNCGVIDYFNHTYHVNYQSKSTTSSHLIGIWAYLSVLIMITNEWGACHATNQRNYTYINSIYKVYPFITRGYSPFPNKALFRRCFNSLYDR